MGINVEYRKLPGVDKLLAWEEVNGLIAENGEALVKYAIREVLANSRKQIEQGGKAPDRNTIINEITNIVSKVSSRSLREVINASGIVLHTNLGRAPMGEDLLNSVMPVLKGYNNLEFNLQEGKRGQRNAHCSEILKYITGAEDVVVVNNNAAAVMLILKTFADGKEAVVSRGELIEIGGSFRIPEIMAASGCNMVEVGATNKTKISDYEGAVGEDTAILFKAHKSNYVIKGFTQEVGLGELAELGKLKDIPVVYDIGSGLLNRVNIEALADEPDVKTALDAGVDMVCFSGDKLLGGPQAGIIAGKKRYIEKIKKAPMMRALRVCKTTLALLETACSYYLDKDRLCRHNVLFKILSRSLDDIERSALLLQQRLKVKGVGSEICSSKGKYGGGTLPDLEIDSKAVKLMTVGASEQSSSARGKDIGKRLYHALLEQEIPMLTNLIAGDIYIDMLTVQDEQIDKVADIVCGALDSLGLR